MARESGSIKNEPLQRAVSYAIFATRHWSNSDAGRSIEIFGCWTKSSITAERGRAEFGWSAAASVAAPLAPPWPGHETAPVAGRIMYAPVSRENSPRARTPNAACIAALRVRCRVSAVAKSSTRISAKQKKDSQQPPTKRNGDGKKWSGRERD